jgi:hypothetical protein
VLDNLAKMRAKKAELAKEREDAEFAAKSPKSRHKEHDKRYRRKARKKEGLPKKIAKLEASIAGLERDLEKKKAELKEARKELQESSGEQPAPASPEVVAGTSRQQPASNEPSPSVAPKTVRRRIWAADKELEFEGAGPHWKEAPTEKRIQSPMYAPDPATVAFGNRICSLEAVMQLVFIAEDHARQCESAALRLVKPTGHGESWEFTLACAHCNATFDPCCTLPGRLDIGQRKGDGLWVSNLAAALSSVTVGSGWAEYARGHGVCNLPSMSRKTFQKYALTWTRAIIDHARESMRAARELERKLAFENLRTVNFEGEEWAQIWLIVDGAHSTRDIGAMKSRAMGCAVAAIGYFTELLK